MTLSDALRQVQSILLRPGATGAEQTAASIFAPFCAPSAASGPGGKPSLTIRLVHDQTPWYSLALLEEGSIRCTASWGSLLIACASLATESWSERPAADFVKGEHVAPAFRWMRNLSDFLVGSLRSARGFDREEYCRQLARQGFTHVTINGLGTPRPFESGPPGDVYHWFYDYSPDLDQFVDSTLLKGYYPADYLEANLAFLKENAALALRFGLTPGLHINSPRSMPEEFWHRYGFLRGARVDHPRETLRPRYTLAMAHPAVQEHYRETLRKVLKEIPEIGFIHLWTNDSGSGFEFVSSLYAGRNGGPYLLREWKGHEEIAQKAGENVLTYLHLLRDEGKRAGPHFRLICDLGPFTDERPTIIAGMGKGIDAGDFAYFESGRPDGERLQEVGAETHVKVEIGENNILGTPFPRLVHEHLAGLRMHGTGYVLTGGTPASLAPYDINREVARSFQLTPGRPLAEVLSEWAERWGGVHAAGLLQIWDLSDRAVRSYPEGVPMSTFGFPWFRLWVRPFVPDIDAIPEEKRRYYERFLLATFNNPARIDLNNDMMWNFLTPAGAAAKKRAIDEGLCPTLDEAIDRAALGMERATGEKGGDVFADLLDRLRAARCYYLTMRNTMAWTESVHGYCQAETREEREFHRALAQEMVGNELENTRDLLALVQTSRAHFMPVLSGGETLHGYGKNFAQLLKRKIALMEEYGDREPRVDPGYMWRMPG